ncbi:MAG: Fic family protein [Spirochaetia bacterium]|jgi:Fic family protein|nr:Fic family protein [Spirochaetia bacterium]
MTIERLQNNLDQIPSATMWLLSDISEYRGMQKMFTRQIPQKLKSLKEFAIIESVVSSNRIEGIIIDHKRIKPVITGESALKDRDEEEIRGYRRALNWIHKDSDNLPLSEDTIQELHKTCRGEIWDSGKYKEKDGDIIETYPDGRSRVRFITASAAKTPALMSNLILAWDLLTTDRNIHPLIGISLFNLDFLCIHPFRDGNGRVSRLLLLLQAYLFGYDVGRYISLERVIEENKDRYYETLELSSTGWHEGTNNPWPFINYMLFIFKSAYKEFESRASHMGPERGEKTKIIKDTIEKFYGNFTVNEIKVLCPEVSIDLIRKVLKDMSKDEVIKSTGKGRGSSWRKI